MSLKDISDLELWQPLCSVEQNQLCSFGRSHHEKQFCVKKMNLDQWFRRYLVKIFLAWSSGGLLVSIAKSFAQFWKRVS